MKTIARISKLEPNTIYFSINHSLPIYNYWLVFAIIIVIRCKNERTASLTECLICFIRNYRKALGMPLQKKCLGNIHHTYRASSKVESLLVGLKEGFVFFVILLKLSYLVQTVMIYFIDWHAISTSKFQTERNTV